MKNIMDMKGFVFGVVAMVMLAIGASCDRKGGLDPKEDYILIRAFEYAQRQKSDSIDIEELKNYSILYENKDARGKLCLCNALIGYKLFFTGDYDKSLIYLKKAEK